MTTEQLVNGLFLIVMILLVIGALRRPYDHTKNR